MEEKFTQIKLNVGSADVASVESAEKKIKEKGEVKAPSTRLDDPETIPMDIAENRQAAPLGEDIPLVSPDEAIFNKITENVNEDLQGSSSRMSDWHDTNVDSDENFIVDEMFASNAHADKKFMETFGIKNSGSVKTVVEKDSSGEGDEDELEATGESYEYRERLQNKDIKKMYDYAVSGIGKRLVMSIICTVLLFFAENISLFLSEPTGIFNISSYPYLHIGISLGLLALCAAFAYEQVYHGFRSILSKDFLPESVGVVALIISVIHSVTSIILVSFGYTSPSMFNFVTAAILVGTILFSFVNVVREEYGFRAISGKDTKFILERVQQNNAEAEYDTFTTTSNGEYNGQIARVGKTGFVKNFFYNTNSNVSIGKFMGIYYLVALILPVVFAIISAIRIGSASQLTAYWGIGVMLMLPIGVLCAYSVPFYIGNKRLFDDGVAIIGEEAINEYAGTDVVVVNDTTAFPPQNIKIQHFHVYNDYTIEKVLYYASNGFSLVGGPLAEVFDAAANESILSSKRVRFMCSGRSYLVVKIDNEKVIFADKFGMTSQGIEVGNEREVKTGTSAMYIAINGVLAAKIFIKYDIDEEFLRVVRLLNKNGTGVGIRSFDPNLNNELIKKVTSFKKRDLRVIKLSSVTEVTKPTAAKDSKIVSKGLSRSLIKAIPVCKKILSTRKVLKAIKIISSIGGAVLLALWTFGKLSFFYSAHIVGYHMIFVVVMMLASLLSMPKLK
ncbi:MAG: hypothetical protein IJX02_01490 [Clostridia bacterium]|nr:hypothetical protein [Clostridia bacterium]